MNSLRVIDNAAVYRGDLQDNSVHSHHAMQIIISPEGEAELLINNRLIKYESIIINHDIPHAVKNTSKNLVIILFEPLLDSLFKLSLDADYEILNQNLQATLLDVISGRIDKNIIKLVFKEKSRIKLDPRIQFIINHVEREENCIHDLTYYEDKLSLSKSRISHLFTGEIGIPLKQYILWKKLLFAIDSIRSVSDLSQIAIDCGFSDLSHLSRTFKKMFGHTTSSIFKNSSSVQVNFSDSL